jgi:hypothetical protein
LALIGVAWFANARSALPPPGNVQAGATAPPITLHAVRGGTWSTATARGRVLLLSFLALDDHSATAGGSRSESLFLQSMERQYGRRGLRIAIVDASTLVTGHAPSGDALLNDTYDWNLGQLLVCADPDGATARRYGVSRAPTTFLIGKDGIVRRRWDGFASAAQLAFAVQPLLPTHVAQTRRNSFG